MLALQSMGLIGFALASREWLHETMTLAKIDNAERVTTAEVEPFLNERNHT